VKGSRDPFGDPLFSNNFFSFGRSETRRFSSGSLLVKVNALPPYNNSAIPFSGVVGKLDIKAELDKTELKAGESATLTLTLSGAGNLMDAQLPAINLPADFKVYDDSPVEEIELTLKGYEGQKVFKKAIVPVNQGSYTIKPLSFSFFNVTNRQYEVASTSSITLNVAPSDSSASLQTGGNLAANGNSAGNGDARPMQKEQVEFLGKDILGLKEGSAVLVNKGELPLLWFTTLFFLPCFLFYLLKLFMVFGKKEISVSTALQRKARESLAAAEKSLKSKSDNGREDFFKSLHGALVAKIFARAGIRGASPTSSAVNDIMASSGYDSDAADRINRLLHEIESSRYGRQENDPQYRQDLFSRARKVFQMLGVMFVCFSILMASPQVSTAQSAPTVQTDPISEVAQAAQPDPSARLDPSVIPEQSSRSDQATQLLKGVESYHSGQYREAAEKFKAVVRSGVRNPLIYYNIGNAYLKAGDTGRAVLWYERSKKEAPFDPDLRFNLEYASGFLKDKVEKPALDIAEVLFFWKGYLPEESLKYASIIISFLFFTYAGVRTIRGKPVLTLAGGIFLGLLLLSGATAFYASHNSTAKNQAVITAPKAYVRSGTSPDATELFILHAGTKVRVQESRGEYLKIFFAKGKIGWVNIGEAEVI